MPEIPKKLHHYTSVEALKSILTYQTIRFSPLSKVDDLQEEKARDAVALGKRVFVSSWCADEHESLPMWDRYAGLCTGVRISLPAKPFKKYHYTARDMEKYPYVVNISADFAWDTHIPIEDILAPNYVIAPYNWNSNILCSVIYTDDEEYLYPKLIARENGYTDVAFSKLGKYKHTRWQYQNEWRYILIVYPYSMREMQLNVNNTQQTWRMANIMLNGTDVPGFEYYDMAIDPTCFSKMEIALGAKMPAHEKQELIEFIKEKNPSAKITGSEFTYTLR